MVEDGPSPAVLEEPVSSSVDGKDEIEDEERKESISIPVNDGDAIDKKMTVLESSVNEKLIEVNDSIECKKAENPSPHEDASAMNSEESLGVETNTTTTESVARSSPLETEPDDLGQLILQKKYGTSNPALLKRYGADTTESGDGISIHHSSAGSDSNSNTKTSIQTRPGAFAIDNPHSESSTRQDNANGDSNFDESANIDTAPLASVVLTRKSTTSIHESIHNDPEVGRRFLEAVCVENQNIVEAKIVAFESIENQRDRSSMRKRYSIVAAIIILGAILSTIAVVATRRNKKAPEDAPMEDGWGTPQEYDLASAEKLKTILAPLSGVDVFNEQSPEFSYARLKALAWLANDKLLPLDDPSMEWKIRQRYVVALLHTSTNGWKWDSQYFFLSEQDECKWNFISAGVDDQSPFDETRVFKATGVVCNENGTVERIILRWNNLVGTIPHELSEFSDSLTEINLDGGSISGQIPQSFEQLTNLERLGLQDNCLTGAIPDFTLIPNLESILIGNNAGLSGSLNDYCVGTEKVNTRNLYADCGKEIDCDCCGCCDPDTFECCSEERGCFISARLNPIPDEKNLMAFRKMCLSDTAQSWITEECPCYVETPTDKNTTGWDWGYECTKDCDAEGAVRSSNLGY